MKPSNLFEKWAPKFWLLCADGDISSHFETNVEHYSQISLFWLFLLRGHILSFFQCLEVNWLKVAPRLPPPFILIWWLYTKARKAIRTINGHQFQLHIHLSAISLLLLRSSYLRICELGNASFSLHLITLVIFHVLINKLALVLFSFTSSSIMIWKGETRLINL